MKAEILIGDCREKLRDVPSESIDACVTDAPYGLSFMGKHWDYDVPKAETWAEVLRVLKPGAHLLSFFGSRTYHRGVVQIEDAGFEIRDAIMWIYGSGFPKSHNLEGEWEGWGTALKPAYEPIVVARKPLVGTVAENVKAHGTGALNIDASRVDGAKGTGNWRGVGGQAGKLYEGGFSKDAPSEQHDAGRWPANIIHDGSDEVLAGFPDDAGAASPVKGNEPSAASVGAITGQRDRVPGAFHGDQGSAARFFYCAKASKSDRDEGLDHLPDKVLAMSNQAKAELKRGNQHRGKSGMNTGKTRKNNHPTVKPTDLMRYLCRLVTPPGGLILDPFMGSGSTGKAAALEGFRFIGCELSPEYVAIAEARIAAAFRAFAASRAQTNLFNEATP